MPPTNETNMILQEILDQLKELRNDLSSNYQRKDAHDTDKDVLQKQIDELKATNEGKLGRWAMIASIISVFINMLFTLHGMKVF